MPKDMTGTVRSNAINVEHLQPADKGADLDFLVGRSGAPRGPRIALTEISCQMRSTLRCGASIC